MPKKDEIYRIWAPPDVPWSPWVKPVLFSFVDAAHTQPASRSVIFRPEWVPKPGSTAFVIDLPEETGVLWGMRLAQLGYRPVPLYNALPFAIGDKTEPSLRPAATVHVEPILASLIQESENLRSMQLPRNAPPAFLLDADRRLAKSDIHPGVFDNRSVCFSTDFPSAGFLLERGIKSVIVVQEGVKFARDLLDTLVLWQEGGIQILRKTYRDSPPPVPMTVTKPSFLSVIWFKLSVALGLRRGELGGFGDIVRASG